MSVAVSGRLLRAGWMAQEPLTTFQDEIDEVAPIPGTGGIFEIRVIVSGPAIGRHVIWSH